MIRFRRRRRRDQLAALERATPYASLHDFSRRHAEQQQADDESRARDELRPIGNVYRLPDEDERPPCR